MHIVTLRRLPLIVAALLGILSAGSVHAQQPAWSIANFAFTERSGRTVTNQDLRGKVWVIGFFYTRCKESCPHLCAAMAELQRELRHTDVVVVALSVDPAHDTPAVLQKYADAWQADPERWLFLTGDKEKIHDLIDKSFLVGRPRENPNVDPGRWIAHSHRLFLIDREGRVRGTYLAVEELPGPGGGPSGLFQVNAPEVQRLRYDAEALAEGRLVPLTALPTVNAVLNGTSALLLVMGYLFIRRRLIVPHVVAMLGAFLVSTLFLASYLYYHFHYGSRPFPGQGWVRPVYFAILLSHTVLAAAVVPLVLLTLYRAARRQFVSHVRIARWTLPVWLYVSVTGVVIYLMLYQLYAP
jgi:protein SCO1/2/putative membrane protein